MKLLSPQPNISLTSHTVKKCPFYLHLPCLGTPLIGLENIIKLSVEKCFSAVEQCVFLHLIHLFLQSKKMCCLLCF